MVGEGVSGKSLLFLVFWPCLRLADGGGKLCPLSHQPKDNAREAGVTDCNGSPTVSSGIDRFEVVFGAMSLNELCFAFKLSKLC